MAIWSSGYSFSVNRYVKKSINRTIHAEIGALSKVPRFFHKHCIIFVWRIRTDGHLSMSKPCENCQRYLKRKCVKTVYYSTEDGNFEKILFN